MVEVIVGGLGGGNTGYAITEEFLFLRKFPPNYVRLGEEVQAGCAVSVGKVFIRAFRSYQPETWD